MDAPAPGSQKRGARHEGPEARGVASSRVDDRLRRRHAGSVLRRRGERHLLGEGQSRRPLRSRLKAQATEEEMSPEKLLAHWLRSVANRVETGAHPNVTIRWPLVWGTIGDDRVAFSLTSIDPISEKTWEQILKEKIAQAKEEEKK